MGDPRWRRRRIAAVSNPKGEAVRVAQGISNATTRQTATELHTMPSLSNICLTLGPHLNLAGCFPLRVNANTGLAKLTLLPMHLPDLPGIILHSM